jgi:hypothetical protein
MELVVAEATGQRKVFEKGTRTAVGSVNRFGLCQYRGAPTLLDADGVCPPTVVKNATVTR